MAGLVIRASAPTRLDFGGGWTDVPPFPEERGGFVCNLAIDRHAEVVLTDHGDRASAASPEPMSPLVHGALRRAGIALQSAPAVRLSSNFPVGAGLGGSSAVGVALAAALNAWRDGRSQRPGSPDTGAHPNAEDRSALAEQSRAVEIEELGIAGGRQDHYAAAFGGALALTFTDRVGVQPIALTSETCDALASRCVLLYTGESRISGATITAVLDSYRNRDNRVVQALDRMAELAREMACALERGDVDALGALVGEHWTHQRALHPAITTTRIDELMTRAHAAGAIGGKALGASGGGCVVLFAPPNGRERLVHAVGNLAEVLPYRVALTGVAVHHTERSARD